MTNDHACVPPRRQARRRSRTVILIIVVLPMLMIYSTALLAMGLTPHVMIFIAATVCGLAVEVVRRGATGSRTPTTIPLATAPPPAEPGAA